MECRPGESFLALACFTRNASDVPSEPLGFRAEFPRGGIVGTSGQGCRMGQAMVDWDWSRLGEQSPLRGLDRDGKGRGWEASDGPSRQVFVEGHPWDSLIPDSLHFLDSPD